MKIECLSSIARSDLKVQMWLLLTATALAVAVVMPLFRSKAKLAGKHVIITGGSDGLGYCLAQEFIRKDCRVSIIARTQSKLDAAVARLEGLASTKPAQVHALPADVANNEQVSAAISEAEAKFGPCDILISNAGITQPGHMHQLPLSAYENIMRVNYMGTVHVTKAVLPGMLHRGSGRLVIVASSMGLLGFSGYTAYAPTKYPLSGLADCLRNELQGSGVNVSISFPADMNTPCYEQETLIKPQDTKDISHTFGSVHEPETVAKKIVAGVRGGQYHLSSPDLGQDILIMDALASWAPRNLPLLLSCLIAPIVPIAMYVCTKWSDHIVRRQRKREALLQS